MGLRQPRLAHGPIHTIPAPGFRSAPQGRAIRNPGYRFTLSSASGGRAVERAAPDGRLREEDPGRIDRRTGRGVESVLLGGGIDPIVTHQQADQYGWAQRQISPAELLRLDPRV